MHDFYKTISSRSVCWVVTKETYPDSGLTKLFCTTRIFLFFFIIERTFFFSFVTDTFTDFIEIVFSFLRNDTFILYSNSSHFLNKLTVITKIRK